VFVPRAPAPAGGRGPGSRAVQPGDDVELGGRAGGPGRHARQRRPARPAPTLLLQRIEPEPLRRRGQEVAVRAASVEIVKVRSVSPKDFLVGMALAEERTRDLMVFVNFLNPLRHSGSPNIHKYIHSA
jgi:hypothetical protein